MFSCGGRVDKILAQQRHSRWAALGLGGVVLGAECCWWPPWGSICGVAVIRAEPCQSTVYRVPRRLQVSSLVRLVCFFGVPSGVGWGTSRFSSRGESRFLGSFSANLIPGAVLILIKLNCTGSFFFCRRGRWRRVCK